MSHHLSFLVGKTIEKVSHLTADETKAMLWYCRPEETTLIEFTDGSAVIVMADPEGNGPGHLEWVSSETVDGAKDDLPVHHS